MNHRKNVSRSVDICVLAFNSVVSDPRVSKQVESLSRAGFTVEVAGFSKSGKPCRMQLHPNAWLQHVATGEHCPEAQWRQLVRRLLARVATLWGAAGLWAASYHYVGQASLPLMVGLVGTIWLLRGVSSPVLRELCTHQDKLPITVGAKLASWLWHRAAKKNLEPLEKAAVQSGARVVHCHDLWTLRAGSRAARRLGAKLVWDAHEIYDHLAQCNAARNAFHRNELFRHQGNVDAFITINESIANYYRRNFPRLPPAEIIKNATPLFAETSYDGRLHAAANLPVNQKILLYQGGFADNRGLQFLVQAASFLGSGWSLVLMGWGKLEEELRSLAEMSNSSRAGDQAAAVAFVGKAPHNELVQWTAGANVGVIPYSDCCLNHRHCTPNKLWEYPAAGVPILCSPMDELKKAVVGYKMGWLIPQPMEAHSLAETVNKLTEDDLLKAQQGCERFMDEENWTTYEQSLLKCYRGLIKK
jgi:glycosyltransferase involved in cell wall biosynthesis